MVVIVLFRGDAAIKTTTPHALLPHGARYFARFGFSIRRLAQSGPVTRTTSSANCPIDSTSNTASRA
jgi:hypothetical protein